MEARSKEPVAAHDTLVQTVLDTVHSLRRRAREKAGSSPHQSQFLFDHAEILERAAQPFVTNEFFRRVH